MQFDPLKRRDFITLLGGAAAAWPLAARAQQPSGCAVIGVLMTIGSRPDAAQAASRAFRQGLQAKPAVIDGRNVDDRISLGATANPSDCRTLAAELVRRRSP